MPDERLEALRRGGERGRPEIAGDPVIGDRARQRRQIEIAQDVDRRPVGTGHAGVVGQAPSDGAKTVGIAAAGRHGVGCLCRRPAQAEPDQCRLTLQIGIADFGRPHLEQVEDAFLAIRSNPIEVRAGDRRIAAAEFRDQSL